MINYLCVWNNFIYRLLITEEDKEKIKYDGGLKSIKICGFIHEDQITVDYWGMAPAKLILPDKISSEVCAI